MQTLPKLESGIPLPPKRGSQNPYVALYKKAKRGDSFVIPASESNRASHYALRSRRKIARRTIDAKRVRVWVIA